MLFDEGPRSDPTPASGTDGMFSFLDRVDDPHFAAVRAALNAWFDRYPAAHRTELRERLFDADQEQAAFWELLLHELYRSAGFTVDVHPELPNSERRPDFLVADEHGAFLLEARVVTAMTDERRRRDRRVKTVVDAINRARPVNFYVMLELIKEGIDQPPARRVLDQLLPWLAGLDPDQVAAEVLSTGSLRGTQRLEVVAADWVLRFTPIPVDPDKRGRLTGPLIGIGPPETRFSEPTAALRGALRRKGRRYGTTPYPLVLALAVEELGVEEGDVAAALFGREVLQLSAHEEPVVSGRYRRDDGYWSAHRSAGTRVAAVLTVATPRPWNVPRLVPRLWLNPWSAAPYTQRRLWRSLTVDVQTGEFPEVEAVTTPADLLSLPDDWPPGKPFARR